MVDAGLPRIWIGGRVGRSKEGIFWENGLSETVERGEDPWDGDGERGAQPDGDQNHRNTNILF